MMPNEMQGVGLVWIVIAVTILAAFGCPMITEFTGGNIGGGLVAMSKFLGWLLVGYLLARALMYMADENFGCESKLGKNLMAAILGLFGVILVVPIIMVGFPWTCGEISDWRDRKRNF